MTSKRVFIVLSSSLVALAVLIGVTAFAANTLLQKQSKKLLGLKAEAQALDQQQTSLIRAKKDIEKYAALKDIAKTVVPQDKDQAQAVREIVSIAERNGVKLSTIGFTASTLGGGASGVRSSPISQAQKVPNISGVYQLPITIQQDVNKPITYGQYINFLGELENNRRTAQVSSINIQPTKDRQHLTFSLQLNEYIKP